MAYSRAVRLAARRFSQRKNAVNGKDDRSLTPLPGREFPKPHSPLWLGWCRALQACASG